MNVQSYAHDGDAFSRWVQTRPDLAPQVFLDLQTANTSLSCSSVLMVRDGRDAAGRLCRLARLSGFEDMSNVFYNRYEWYCRQLLVMTGGK